MNTAEKKQKRNTYVMQRIGSFVHSITQELGDAKLLLVSSDIIGSSAQDVVHLREQELKA